MTKAKKQSGWAKWREKQGSKPGAQPKSSKKKVSTKKAAPTKRLKQYVGISRDHSGSMSHLVRAAMNDYNSLITDINEATRRENIDTLVSTVLNGIGPGRGIVKRETVNSNVEQLKKLTTYPANGGSTPLWDSVGELIEIFEEVRDYKDLDVSFMVMVVTDGGENDSVRWSTQRLAKKIKELQATDRWTFVFRVPRGHKNTIVNQLGVFDDNVIEWDTTSAKDLERTTGATQFAMSQFYGARSAGVTSSTRFYANMAAVKPAEVKRTLQEVKDRNLEFFPVQHDVEISTMIERYANRRFMKGAAFYQLTKTEDVQDHKIIAVREKSTKKTYTGPDARDMLGLPGQGTIRLSPGNNGNFDVFVQSTSLNRKLIAGTEVMYWPAAAR